jgi:hypothetical protein
VEVVRLRRRLAALTGIDFFGAPGREIAEGLVSDLERQVHARPAAVPRATRLDELRGRTWVTRKGVHIDRIASAWLIRRFVDADGRFKFVPARGYRPEPGELRFDMFEAEFTHEGDQCTIEVLVARLGLDDPALGPLAEIVLEPLIAGLAVAHRDDEERLVHGGAVLDALYEYFRRKRR